ncbi:Bgt-20571 [Blumeria graminis f. sp. tritici]|uniref:Bgt-20571 n=2 Tax=Blumeria graminis f. sp. tritici TaxID=62690 RepID=A0A381LA50_BLUGR|nr:Bgt-20571 [Blumeria graminis f. sp. tritici]
MSVQAFSCQFFSLISSHTTSPDHLSRCCFNCKRRRASLITNHHPSSNLRPFVYPQEENCHKVQSSSLNLWGDFNYKRSHFLFIPRSGHPFLSRYRALL